MKRNFVSKWFDFVANLTWADVKQRYAPAIQEQFAHVRDVDKVNLERYRELRGDTVVLSAFCGVPAAKRAKLARKSKAARARGERNLAAGEKGKLVIKVGREQLMTWAENFVADFNTRESSGKTDLIIPCLTKVGQNPFSSDTESFNTWLDSLNRNALYKSLLAAHTATNL